MHKAAVGLDPFLRTGIRLIINRSCVQSYPEQRAALAMPRTAAVINPVLWARLTFTQ